MKKRLRRNSGVAAALTLMVLALGIRGTSLSAVVLFEVTSVYHNIRVVQQGGVRFLSFDGSQETRMSVANHLQGHFEYTEYFHMPWLWNGDLKKVLMIGLGGASTHRSFQHYYPEVRIDAVELDALVVEMAKRYFHLKESPTLKIHMSDGRVFLRRTNQTYDTIIMDAYTSNRYGSFIPHQLATKEFFEMANERLSEDGTLAYNVMGSLNGWRANLIGSMYKTMKSVFPNVYLFPASESKNVVLIAAKSEEPLTTALLKARIAGLIRDRKMRLPTFRKRLNALRAAPPRSAFRSPLLTDDYAPVEGLMR